MTRTEALDEVLVPRAAQVEAITETAAILVFLTVVGSVAAHALGNEQVGAAFCLAMVVLSSIVAFVQKRSLASAASSHDPPTRSR